MSTLKAFNVLAVEQDSWTYKQGPPLCLATKTGSWSIPYKKTVLKVKHRRQSLVFYCMWAKNWTKFLLVQAITSSWQPAAPRWLLLHWGLAGLIFSQAYKHNRLCLHYLWKEHSDRQTSPIRQLIIHMLLTFPIMSQHGDPVTPKIKSTVPCIIVELSRKFHKNPLIVCWVMMAVFLIEQSPWWSKI